MSRASTDSARVFAPAGRGIGVLTGAVLLALAALVYIIGSSIYRTYSLSGLTIFTGALFLIVALAIISVQRIEIAILFWVVSISGFRNSLLVDLPGLPDVTPDRILLIWIVAATLVRSLARPRPLLPPYLPDFVVIAHTIYLLGSCLIANPLSFNMWTRSYLMPAAGYFFGKYLLSDLRWFQRLIYLLVAINLYMGITSVAQHFQWNDLVWPQSILTAKHPYVHRSVGIFIQPAVLGVFLGMVLPFQFYLHLSLRSDFWRWFHFVGILICISGLLFTYTRGGWVATGVGILVMAFLGRRAYLRRLLIYGAVTTLVMGTGLLSFKQDTFLQERLETESTIEGRINVAATSYHMWRSHPILGIGFKRFNDLAGDYRETLHVPIYGLIKANIDTNSSPHDIYISVLAEEGIAGALLQALIYVAIFKALMSAYSTRRKSDDAIGYWLLPPVGATLVAYMIGGGAFDYRFFESLNSHFYVFGGIIIAWSTNRVAGIRTAAVTSAST